MNTNTHTLLVGAISAPNIPEPAIVFNDIVSGQQSLYGLNAATIRTQNAFNDRTGDLDGTFAGGIRINASISAFADIVMLGGDDTAVGENVRFSVADPNARVNVYLGPQARVNVISTENVNIPLTLDPNNVAGSGRGTSTFVPGSNRVDPPPREQAPVTDQNLGGGGNNTGGGNDTTIGDNTGSNTGGNTSEGSGPSGTDLAALVAIDVTAANNASRTSVTDLSSIRARAVDGVLSLDAVQQAAQTRQDFVLDITAEVSVGSITTGDVDVGAASVVTGDGAEGGVDASGTIEIDCEIPENIDLQQCRIDVGE